MNCKDTQARLQPFLENHLSAVEARQVQSHLHSCVACAELKSDFERLTSAARGQLAVKAPDNFDALLRQRLSEFGQSQHFERRFLPSWAWGTAAAFLVLFALIGLFFNIDQKSNSALISRGQVTPVALPSDPGTPRTHFFVPGEKNGLLLQVPVRVKITSQQLTQDFFLREVSH
ncbi:MAG TPA: zf-HC2 domain-containing protein [Acidobacteriota bacterium]|jgi:anti-sigma factor RsiW|nr:zf-HC2 domain-containing protein [Acidobacteriota bacterium]